MTEGSLCAMGGLTPLPVRSALTHFPDDFLGGRRLLEIHPVRATEGTA
jgi:formate dehydrogenase iron-sulfur subunit